VAGTIAHDDSGSVREKMDVSQFPVCFPKVAPVPDFPAQVQGSKGRSRRYTEPRGEPLAIGSRPEVASVPLGSRKQPFRISKTSHTYKERNSGFSSGGRPMITDAPGANLS
jgi:hypothetical protein